VLSNVSAEFKRGLIHAVVGPSGSGKTTLLSIVAGLDSPMSGRVTLGGTDLAEMDLDKYRRESVAMIFQAFQLFPLLTAIENVCVPMQLSGISRSRAKEEAGKLLRSVGIDDPLHKRYPSNLSGGEQQRVAIARALSSGAGVILADEPTGSLDEANGEAIMSILRKLAQEDNYCVIVVTHNPEIAGASDVVFRMSGGLLT